MGDLFTTSVAPSARSLLCGKQIVAERSGVYALGDPRPTHQGLQWGEADHTLVKLARHLGLIAEARVQGKASRIWLIEALQRGRIVDASCHGTFNIPEPLQSALALAQHED